MKNVKVLGPVCTRCKATEERVKVEAARLRIDVSVEKSIGHEAIAQFGIVSTPGIVIDSKVVHAGGLPKADDLQRWLLA